MRKKSAGITEQIGRAGTRLRDGLELTPDLTPGLPRVTLTGSLGAWIENYRGLAEVTDTCIRVQCRSGSIRFEGSRLTVDYYTDEEMRITGRIQTVQFL